jgi:hypothetical protein
VASFPIEQSQFSPDSQSKTMTNYDAANQDNSRSSVNALGWSQLIESFQKQRVLKTSKCGVSAERNTDSSSRSRVGEAFFDAGMEAMSKVDVHKMMERETFGRPKTNLSTWQNDWEQLATDVTARLADDCFAIDGWRMQDDSISLSSQEPDFSFELGLLESLEEISRDIAETIGTSVPRVPLTIVPSHATMTVAE